MVPFVWLEAHPHEKDVWKFVSTISGEQYVMTIGEPVMLMWHVGNLDTVGRVSIHMLSLCPSLLLWSRMSHIHVQYLGCLLSTVPIYMSSTWGVCCLLYLYTCPVPGVFVVYCTYIVNCSLACSLSHPSFHASNDICWGCERP